MQHPLQNLNRLKHSNIYNQMMSILEKLPALYRQIERLELNLHCKWVNHEQRKIRIKKVYSHCSSYSLPIAPLSLSCVAISYPNPCVPPVMTKTLPLTSMLEVDKGGFKLSCCCVDAIVVSVSLGNNKNKKKEVKKKMVHILNQRCSDAMYIRHIYSEHA